MPVLARELAARLSVLFERDVEIVRRLNDAQRRVREANERLWSGLSPDAFGLIYDGMAPAGSSEIAALMMGGACDAETAVLGALQEIHWAITSVGGGRACLKCGLRVHTPVHTSVHTTEPDPAVLQPSGRRS